MTEQLSVNAAATLVLFCGLGMGIAAVLFFVLVHLFDWIELRWWIRKQNKLRSGPASDSYDTDRFLKDHEGDGVK